MLFLRVDNLLTGPSVISAPWFELEGKYLRKGPSGEILAEHVNNTWCIAGNCYSSLTFTSRACIHFGARSAEGPFDEVRLVDGYLHVNGHLFARLLADSWHCFPRGERWTKLTIKPPLSHRPQSKPPARKLEAQPD